MSIKYLSGTIKWHKNKELDKYGKRTLDLYMDEDNWNKYKAMELGIKTRDNKDTGEQFVTLSRKKIGYGKNSVEFELGPWEVLNKDGTEYTGEIWNGSTVTIKMDTYFSKASGSNVARVEAVRIDNLAEASREPDEVIDEPF